MYLWIILTVKGSGGNGACHFTRIIAMIGGFHLFNKDDAYIRAFAHRVEKTGAEAIYTGHCTGKKAFDILCGELGSKVHGLKTGGMFEVG